MCGGVFTCLNPVIMSSFSPPPLVGSQRGVKRSTGQVLSLSPPHLSLIHVTIKQLGIKGGQIPNLSIVISSLEVGYHSASVSTRVVR